MGLRMSHIKGAGAAKSPLEEALALQLRVARIPFTRQVRFHPVRKWVFDFVILGTKVAIEVEGGTWMKKGAHNTGLAMKRDMEKYNEATRLGWSVYRFDNHMVKSGDALEYIRGVLANAGRHR